MASDHSEDTTKGAGGALNHVDILDEASLLVVVHSCCLMWNIFDVYIKTVMITLR